MQMTSPSNNGQQRDGFLTRLCTWFNRARRGNLRPAPTLYTLDNIMYSCGFPPDDYKTDKLKNGEFARIVHTIRDGGAERSVELCPASMNDIAIHLNTERTIHELTGEDRVFTFSEKLYSAGLLFVSEPDRPGFYSVGAYHISPDASSFMDTNYIHRANPDFAEKRAQEIMSGIKQLLETKFPPKTPPATVDSSIVTENEPKHLTYNP